jgi:hypothetical protein
MYRDTYAHIYYICVSVCQKPRLSMRQFIIPKREGYQDRNGYHIIMKTTLPPEIT